jgi:hypothetical protein
MSSITLYPEFAPLSLEMAREISPHLVRLPDGVSEFSFAGLYLFRDRYDYRAAIKTDLLVISGKRAGSAFFITPCCSTGPDTIAELFKTHDYWKLISPAFVAKNREWIEGAGYSIEPDRDNFDYVYLREDLATLPGKRFHKKKNHVNAFEKDNPDISVKPLDAATRDDARVVLEHWVAREENPEETDYKAACEALDLLESFAMEGLVLYSSGVPVAWTLAETVADGKMSAVHFEKARTDYRGAYQYINYAFARYLPPSVEFVNREQDLGDEGMRQAKMTYRPAGFVEKFKVTKRP